MNRFLRLSGSSWLALAMAVVVVIWMLSGTVGESTPTPTIVEPTRPDQPPIVQTRLSRAEPMTSELVLAGHIRADRQVVVKAETSGVVSEILAARGAEVASGDVLMRFTEDDRQAHVLEARSRLADVRTRLDAADRLQSQNLQTEAELNRLKAELDSASAALQMAELELERTRVRAPFDGVINERYVETGDFVSRGQPLALVVDLNPMRAVGQVSERYLGQIRPGVEGEVRTLDNRQYVGRVSYVGRIADAVTRTIPVEMEVPNPEGYLIEGITAELTLPVTEVKAHRVALSVLDLADDGSLGVKTVDEADTVVFHTVRVLGDSLEGLWIADLPDQVRLITAGQAFVQPGQSVRVVSEASEP